MGISEKIFIAAVVSGTLTHLNPKIADKMTFKETLETRNLPALANSEAEAKNKPDVQQQIEMLRIKYKDYGKKTTVFTIVGKDKSVSLQVKTDPFRQETEAEILERGNKTISLVNGTKNNLIK